MHRIISYSSWVSLFLLMGCQDLSLVEQDKEWVIYFDNQYPAPDTIPEQLGVLTFNIQMGFSNDQTPFQTGAIGGSPAHLDALAEAIANFDPDFVALQDVARAVSHTIIEDQVGYLADALQMNYAYADYSEVNTFNGVFIRGSRGHALLSKYPIVHTENHEILNRSRYDSRSCHLTKIQLAEDQHIVFLGTHFKGGAALPAKELQTDLVLELAAQQNDPIILLGDVNNTLRNDHIKRISSHYPSVLELISAQERRWIETYGTFGNPYLRRGIVIDNIFMDTAAFEVEHAYLMPEIFWPLSDHRYVYAMFAYR